jgi:hypothetical protein
MSQQKDSRLEVAGNNTLQPGTRTALSKQNAHTVQRLKFQVNFFFPVYLGQWIQKLSKRRLVSMLRCFAQWRTGSRDVMRGLPLPALSSPINTV